MLTDAVSRKMFGDCLMRIARKSSFWIMLALAAGLTLVGVFLRRQHGKAVTITGAVTVQDADPRKQLPVEGVEITAANNSVEPPAKSDSSGFFSLRLRKGLRRGQPVTLMFRHPNYHPLDLPEFAGDKLYIAHLVPLSKNTDNVSNRPAIAVGNLRVRYSIMAMRTVNVGSAVRTFQVENVGNISCKGQPPCSPDGKWKAAIASASLDAGLGNEFQNARVSCIAGPCPFTKIVSDEFAKSSQKITATARDWSDPATFLVEAEVVHTMQSPIEHQSYPVIFGAALSFTLPTDSEGVSLEADVAGETIIFPLGPKLFLTWANCNARVNPDHTSVYRCELKPGYRFQ
jgi:hypothetical protein